MADLADPKNLVGGGDTFAAIVKAQKAAEADLGFAGGTLVRPSISEQVSNRILAMIKSGNLKAEDRLPTEQQMCLAFGISRPPLREALKALTLMGILESRQGGRYMVTDLSPTRLVTPFNVLLSVPDHDIQVQFEARAVVELELVRFCVERANDEQRARILALAKDGRTFYEDPVGFRLLDAEYHQAINEGANNTILSTISEGLYNVAIDARRLASATQGVIDISVDQHIRVAEAIGAHDATAAVQAYQEHLDHVLSTTIQAIHELSE
ncbi:MAG: FCD domain-containing protein [Rhodobacteraceae bacterium]|nr:FCD domain-containing protein [Paracoccaceae bacterium]